MSKNQFVHAVAGSGKTQAIVDRCLAQPDSARVLVLTFTTANQAQLRQRIGPLSNVDVMGWFEFLLKHWAGPYVPFLYPGRRVRGFNFDGEQPRITGARRYFDSNGAVYRRGLAKLACLINEESNGVPLEWLTRRYSEIIVDEVQDLSGWDLELMALLFSSDIPTFVVGDVRQAILSTDERSMKNSRYKNYKIMNWFRNLERRQCIVISDLNETHRCRQEIASFADSVLPSDEFGFSPTVSLNTCSTTHDGVYLVPADRVDAYVRRYSPKALRYDRRSGRQYELAYSTFGEAKGLTYKRVLIVPTSGFERFLVQGSPLAGLTACKFYVGITRAEQSVGIVVRTVDGIDLPAWQGE